MNTPDSEPILARLSRPQPIAAKLVAAPPADSAAVVVTGGSDSVASSTDLPNSHRQPPSSEIVAARLVHAAVPVSWPRRALRMVSGTALGLFRFASLTVLLALIAAVPALQLLAFGYLLEVVGRLSRGGQLRDCLPWSRYATRLGLALLALGLVSLPVHLLTHWSQVSRLVDPASRAAEPLRILGIAAAVLAAIYLAWAWMRGGKLRHYLWPAPLRFVTRFWRPSTWVAARDDLWKLFVSLEIPRLFWLGLRGVVGTLVWITIPALLLIVANREGRGGGAGLLAAMAFLSMGIVLIYLPLLQANFAAENRLSAMFELGTVRRYFRQAPWALTISMLLVYGLAIPLYLLKIETLPREATWLPCLMFVALMLPARIAFGLAMRRARRLAPPRGFWKATGRWSARLLIPVIVGSYMLAVFLSQYLDVHGLQTWFHQHAVLVPVPFTGT